MPPHSHGTTWGWKIETKGIEKLRVACKKRWAEASLSRLSQRCLCTPSEMKLSFACRENTSCAIQEERPPPPCVNQWILYCFFPSPPPHPRLWVRDRDDNPCDGLFSLNMPAPLLLTPAQKAGKAVISAIKVAECTHAHTPTMVNWHWDVFVFFFLFNHLHTHPAPTLYATAPLKQADGYLAKLFASWLNVWWHHKYHAS